MEDEDYRLFEGSLTDAVAQRSGEALDAALDELGWADALIVDRRAAIGLLFRLQGATNVTSSALGRVLAHGVGLGDRPGTGILLPPVGRWDPPGRVHGDELVVGGIGPAWLLSRESALVITSTGERTIAVTVPSASLSMRPVDGMDPDLAWVEVTGTTSLSDHEHETLVGPWDQALALGRLAVAHELVGASRTMLGLARQHALDRIQFGRPISSFQAIRHRLAETLVGIEMADAMIESAWHDQDPETAAMAKSVAGRQARTAARHSQQVLAGIGFTTEHALHRYIRRVLVLDGLLGSSTNLTKALGVEVMRTGRLPGLVPL